MSRKQNSCSWEGHSRYLSSLTLVSCPDPFPSEGLGARLLSNQSLPVFYCGIYSRAQCNEYTVWWDGTQRGSCIPEAVMAFLRRSGPDVPKRDMQQSTHTVRVSTQDPERSVDQVLKFLS